MSDTDKKLEKIVKELLEVKKQVEELKIVNNQLKDDVVHHVELFNNHIKDLHINK